LAGKKIGTAFRVGSSENFNPRARYFDFPLWHRVIEQTGIRSTVNSEFFVTNSLARQSPVQI
jgi:hypothetical protein